MGQAIGDLPLAVGVAISLIPIVAVILMLLARRAGRTSASLPPGWVIGIAGATTAFLLPAVGSWRAGPEDGEQSAMPKWLSAIDPFTAAIGVLRSAVNPKNLLLCVAASTAIAGDNLSAEQKGIAVAVFTAIAASTVATPVLAHAIARKRTAGRLESLHAWLTLHNQAGMASLLLIIGASLIGKTLGGLRDGPCAPAA